MTAPRDCRPPPNTPDGTVCWLYNGMLELRWIWRIAHEGWPDHWQSPRTGMISRAGEAHRAGWRFHSIAEPPHE